jgi:DNA-binding NtrC family response regulator
VRQDIGVLAQRFLEHAAESFAKPAPRLDADGVRKLESYDWPGNARELRNVIERALIFSTGPTLNVEPFLATAPARTAANGGAAAGADGSGGIVPLGLTLDEAERRYIEATLAATGGNVNEAAKRLGVTRKVLWARRRKHGLI